MTPDTPHKARSKTATRFFWGTLIGLALIVVLAAAAAYFVPPRPTSHDIPVTRLEVILSETAEQARIDVLADLEDHLDRIYGPAYAAIPHYAEFHYSILGEYVELGEAALGQSSQALEERLLNGFDDRASQAADQLDAAYVQAFSLAVNTRIRQETPPDALALPLGELTQGVVSDAVDRVKVTAPVAATAVLGTKGALKATSKLFAKKIATKVSAKAAAKGIAKGGGIAAGAGGGALLCSWSGPGAAVCGAAGALVVWLVTDAVIIELDEYYNRDEFEAELRAMLDEDRAEKRILFENALTQKARSLEDFQLRQLGPTE